MPATLFDKLWDSHVVRDLGDGWALLHIDRHLLHEMSGGPALVQLERMGLAPRNPELTFATTDHVLSSAPGRTLETHAAGAALCRSLQASCAEHGITHFAPGSREQGIVHVIGPELGLSLPGMTIVCGDSHTCTHGGLGALAFGIGSTEVAHVLATQTLVQRRPRSMRLRFDGEPAFGVVPKDLILHAIARFGAGVGSDHAIEYAGTAVEAMDIEGRLTLCNLSVEMGAKFGFVAPDARTLSYVEGRPFAPHGLELAKAAAHWASLHSEPGAHFDCELRVDAGSVAPMVTWGTSPEHALPIDGRIPEPAQDAANAAAWQAALDYMGRRGGCRPG